MPPLTAEEVEQMMRELMGAVQSVLSSGEELSDEVQGAIAQTLDMMMTKIDELRSSVEKPTGEIEMLWQLAGRQEQAFISYLRNFPSAETQKLLSQPHYLSMVLQQLQQKYPPEEEKVKDGIPQAPLQSSNVWGAKYDPSAHQMTVRFQGGSEYKYYGIPQNIFKAMIKGNAAARTSGKNRYGSWWVGKNPSIGAALHQYVKQAGFPYQKVK